MVSIGFSSFTPSVLPAAVNSSQQKADLSNFGTTLQSVIQKDMASGYDSQAIIKDVSSNPTLQLLESSFSADGVSQTDVNAMIQDTVKNTGMTSKLGFSATNTFIASIGQILEPFTASSSICVQQ